MNGQREIKLKSRVSTPLRSKKQSKELIEACEGNERKKIVRIHKGNFTMTNRMKKRLQKRTYIDGQKKLTGLAKFEVLFYSRFDSFPLKKKKTLNVSIRSNVLCKVFVTPI